MAGTGGRTGERLRVWRARIVFGYLTRAWPWKVPAGVVRIGLKRPPESAFDYFRRLHGITEDEDAS